MVPYRAALGLFHALASDFTNCESVVYPYEPALVYFRKNAHIGQFANQLQGWKTQIIHILIHTIILQ